MKEKIEEININEEYEKLVPPSERKSLFDDSEDYVIFRQYIIEQPRTVFLNMKLPFSEVKLLSIVEYKKHFFIEKEISRGKHIFYIKQSKKGSSDFCDSAGYYLEQIKGFVILPYSHIITEPKGYFPKKHSRKGELDGKNLYLLTPLIFKSPDDAASFVFGKRAGLEKWVDSRGKGLLTYYKELIQHPFQPEMNLFDSVNRQYANKLEEWIDEDWYVQNTYQNKTEY